MGVTIFISGAASFSSARSSVPKGGLGYTNVVFGFEDKIRFISRTVNSSGGYGMGKNCDLMPKRFASDATRIGK